MEACQQAPALAGGAAGAGRGLALWAVELQGAWWGAEGLGSSTTETQQARDGAAA